MKKFPKGNFNANASIYASAIIYAVNIGLDGKGREIQIIETNHGAFIDSPSGRSFNSDAYSNANEGFDWSSKVGQSVNVVIKGSSFYSDGYGWLKINPDAFYEARYASVA